MTGRRNNGDFRGYCSCALGAGYNCSDSEYSTYTLRNCTLFSMCIKIFFKITRKSHPSAGDCNT